MEQRLKRSYVLLKRDVRCMRKQNTLTTRGNSEEANSRILRQLIEQTVKKVKLVGGAEKLISSGTNIGPPPGQNQIHWIITYDNTFKKKTAQSLVKIQASVIKAADYIEINLNRVTIDDWPRRPKAFIQNRRANFE